ncbi:MAG: cysteine-rich small domain-containing protein [Roseburia sp.]
MTDKKNYSFFQHRECEYFPCHEGADRENFNCLFCYCPLYALGERCGGNYVYRENGVKDCTHCLYPHRRENYEAINARYREIMELANRNRRENRDTIGEMI